MSSSSASLRHRNKKKTKQNSNNNQVLLNGWYTNEFNQFIVFYVVSLLFIAYTRLAHTVKTRTLFLFVTKIYTRRIYQRVRNWYRPNALSLMRSVWCSGKKIHGIQYQCKDQVYLCDVTVVVVVSVATRYDRTMSLFDKKKMFQLDSYVVWFSVRFSINNAYSLSYIRIQFYTEILE